MATQDQPFWLVWNPDGRSPTRKHPSRNHATREAERLSRENPGARFYVLATMSVSRRVDVETTELLADVGIPF